MDPLCSKAQPQATATTAGQAREEEQEEEQEEQELSKAASSVMEWVLKDATRIVQAEVEQQQHQHLTDPFAQEESSMVSLVY